MLARGDSHVVAVIGSGVEARTHATALARLPGVEVVRVAGRDPRRVRMLVDDLVADGVNAESAPSPEEAARSADVVCITTHADRPVVHHQWLRPGTHINSVGYNTAGEGEIDAETVRSARVVVESRAAAFAEPPSGAVELRGVIDAEQCAEVGEVATGIADGRADDQQLTLYKSVGVAVQDATAATFVLAEAQRRGRGTVVAM